MARMVSTLRLETDLIDDAIADLERISRALPHRHGQAFRHLDRQIERLTEAGIGTPELHTLGEGLFLMGVPENIAAVIREARQLGVI